MKELADSLVATVISAELKLRGFTEKETSQQPEAGGWTKKELLGHLVDSASNNHQRFVRLQLADDLRLPKYEQEGWVRVQQYRTTDWLSLVELWSAYNLHLARVMMAATPETLAHTCRVGDGEPVTLQFLMEDYIAHMHHHFKKLLSEPAIADNGGSR